MRTGRAVRSVLCGSAPCSLHRPTAAAFASVASSANHSPASYSSSSSSSSPSTPSSTLSSEYVPRWQYHPSSTRRPSRSEVLHTYQSLLRLVRRVAQGQQQLWAKQRSERWQTAAKPPSVSQSHSASQQQAAGKSAIPLFEYSDQWLIEVRRQYRAHARETDERRIGILHSDALEYAALLDANMQHSREVYEAGWGMQQATKAHVANTARRVGLEVSDSMLDREVEAELREEAKERGEEDWNVDETIARLEAVERRKKKETDTKAKTASATTPAAESTGLSRTDKSK